jgi:hypothetical protein
MARLATSTVLTIHDVYASTIPRLQVEGADGKWALGDRRLKTFDEWVASDCRPFLDVTAEERRVITEFLASRG